VNAVHDWPAPTKLQELQSFLGFSNFLRRDIKQYSSIVAPLTDLVGKNNVFLWGLAQDAAFNQIKAAITSASALLIPSGNPPTTSLSTPTPPVWLLVRCYPETKAKAYDLLHTNLVY
jgi:hypothetical protein